MKYPSACGSYSKTLAAHALGEVTGVNDSAVWKLPLCSGPVRTRSPFEYEQTEVCASEP